MGENKHILSAAVSDMPYHKPDDSVLQRLESNLFEFPVVDMPNYSPDENLWDKIEASINKLDKVAKFRRRSLFLTLLLLAGLFLGHMISNHNLSSSDQLDEVSQLKLNASNISKANPEIVNYVNNKNITNQDEVKENQQFGPVTNNWINNEDEVENNNLINNKLLEVHTKITQPIQSINSLAMRESHLIYDIKDPVFSVEKLQENNAMTNTDCSEFTGPSGYFSIGISGGYNFIKEKDDNDITYESNWYSVNAILSYNRNRLYFGTGIGMSFSTNYSNLDYSYLQNELVNTYTNVDSVYYDPITGTTEFYTSTVEVWDSIEYQQQQEVKTEYKYMQIPVFIGYEFIKKRGICFGISAGFTFIQLLEKSDNYPSLTIKNGRVTEVNYLTHDRRKTLFKFDMQVDLRINLSKNIYTLISPSASFFNNSIYNSNSKQATFSPGVRCGLYYTF